MLYTAQAVLGANHTSIVIHCLFFFFAGRQQEIHKIVLKPNGHKCDSMKNNDNTVNVSLVSCHTKSPDKSNDIENNIMALQT